MNNISLFWQWDCRVIQWGGGWASIARWVMGSFQYFKKYWKSRAWWKDDMASINLSKLQTEAENTVLLDAKNFLGDIDSISLNAISTNVSDHLAGYICHKKKLKLYDECCDQLLLSGEPNSAYIEILSTGGLKNRSMRTMLRGTVTKAFFLLDASSNVIRRSALDSKSAGIVILQKFFDSPAILCHNQRDEFIFHLINTIYNCFFSAQTKTLTKLQLSKIK